MASNSRLNANTDIRGHHPTPSPSSNQPPQKVHKGELLPSISCPSGSIVIPGPGTDPTGQAMRTQQQTPSIFSGKPSAGGAPFGFDYERPSHTVVGWSLGLHGYIEYLPLLSGTHAWKEGQQATSGCMSCLDASDRKVLTSRVLLSPQAWSKAWSSLDVHSWTPAAEIETDCYDFICIYFYAKDICYT